MSPDNDAPSDSPGSAGRMDRPEQHLVMDAAGLPLPPWRMFPYWPTSMGWRMGDGDWYLGCWQAWYLRLDADQQRAYRRTYRAPLYWLDFYWPYGNGPLGCFLTISVSVVTLPVRLVAYCWHRLTRDGIA